MPDSNAFKNCQKSPYHAETITMEFVITLFEM